MIPQEFEKDDLSNHQVQFITYASNLRAEAYGILPADVNTTRRIAGNIIPAMVTTTALVTGLVGFEMLKYLLVQFQHELKINKTNFVSTSASQVNNTAAAAVVHSQSNMPYIPSPA